MTALRIFTFGDSVLACEHYNPARVTPAGLACRNHDELFPEFRGRDLASRGIAATLHHRARDGATSDGLQDQLRGLDLSEGGVALVTVGGNDLLQGLIRDPTGEGIDRLAQSVESFLRQLPLRPVLLGNVYDPTFADDSKNFMPVDPALGRRNHLRYNALLAEMAPRYGALVDLHSHFMSGSPSWFTGVIEPSLEGASEIRRAFLPHLLAAVWVAGEEVVGGASGSGDGGCAAQ